MSFETANQPAEQSGTSISLTYKLKVLAVFGVLFVALAFVAYEVYKSFNSTVDAFTFFQGICSQEAVYSDLSKITDPSLVCGLDLRGKQNGQILPQVFQFSELKALALGNNHLKTLPPDIGKLVNLVRLGLGNNELRDLPKEIGNLTHLESLGLYKDKFNTLPEGVSKLVNLKTLVLIGNNFSDAEKERIKKLLPSTQITF